jgi:hypothetical protein
MNYENNNYILICSFRWSGCCGEEKNRCPYLESNTDSSIFHPLFYSTILMSYSGSKLPQCAPIFASNLFIRNDY